MTELISIAIGLLILLSALGFRLGPKAGKVMQMLARIFSTLLFISCLAATIGLLYVGSQAHWSSDGPGMVLVLIGIALFGGGTLASGAFCLAVWGAKPREPAVDPLEFRKTEIYSPFGLANKIPGISVISGWKPFVVAAFLIGGPLVSLANKMPTIFANLLKSGVSKASATTSASAGTAAGKKRRVVDFSQAASSPLPSVAKGPRWVLKIGNQLAVLRLGQFTPEWIVPTQTFVAHRTIPTFQNRFIVVGSSPVEVWDLSQRKKIYSATYSFDAFESGLLGDHGEFIGTVVGSSKKPTEFKVENIKTHELRYRFDLRGYEIGQVVFDPAGRYVALTLSRQTFALFDSKNNSLTSLRPEAAKLGSMTRIVFSPDGSKLAVGTGRAVTVYSLPTSAQGAADPALLIQDALHLEYPSGSRGGLSPIQFSKDSSQLLARDGDMSFARFDLVRNRPPDILRYSRDQSARGSGESAARRHAVSPKGDQIVALYDGSDKLLKWDAPAGGLIAGPDELCIGDCKLERTPNGNLALRDLEYSPDGWWIMIQNGDSIEFWNGIENQIVDFEFKMPAALVTDVASGLQNCPGNAAGCVKDADKSREHGDVASAIESLTFACELGDSSACIQAASDALTAHQNDVAIKNLDQGYLLSGGAEGFLEMYKKINSAPSSARSDLSLNLPRAESNASKLNGIIQCAPPGDFAAVPHFVNGKCEGLRVHSTIGNGWLNLQTADIVRETSNQNKQGFCSSDEFNRKLIKRCAGSPAGDEAQFTFEVESVSDGHKTLFGLFK